MAAKTRAVSAKGVAEFRPYITKALPITAELACVDNTGATVLRKQIFGAVIVRQKYPIRRLNGVRVTFEDNAAVLVTPEGEIKGTDIKGPVAAEAAEKWPRIANLASFII